MYNIIAKKCKISGYILLEVLNLVFGQRVFI